MKVAKEVCVYLYEITCTPEVFDDAYLKNMVFRDIRKKLTSLFGLYVISGRGVFTTVDLNETFIIKTVFKGTEYEIKVDHTTKHCFEG